MAPSASDPHDLKLILNPARQRALGALVKSIVSHMRSKLELCFGPLSPVPNNQDSRPSPEPETGPERNLSTTKLEELRSAALDYFNRWQDQVVSQLRKIINSPEDPRSEQRRREYREAKAPPPAYAWNNPEDKDKTAEADAQALAEEAAEQELLAREISFLQDKFPPLATRLTTIPREDRICVLSCMLLLVLGLGHYSAHSRVFLCYITSSFSLPLSILDVEEAEVARTLLLASKALSGDAEAQKRRDENQSARRWKVGLASIAGAAVIGITGGLAAPVVAGAIGGIMAGVGLGGMASFLGIFAMNGALVGTLFGAFGGKMTGSMVDAYTKEVEDFKFLPVRNEGGELGAKDEDEVERRRLRVTIGINGWLDEEGDIMKPWTVLGLDSEAFVLRYEMDALMDLGKSLKTMVSSYAWSYVKLEILRRTVLATLWSALWPVYLLRMATSVDNPFAVAMNRSEKAGGVLADALINKAQGERPVNLIGYSLGSRVIYSCLKSLADRKAFGLVESVVFIGSPVPSNEINWRVMRSVVSGNLVNVYSENDYILAFVYRATSIQFGVAGLQKVPNVEGVNNLDLSKDVSGHLRYPNLVGKILKKGGFLGVQVDDAEIEKEKEDDVPIRLIDTDEDSQKFNGDAGHLIELTALRDVNSEPSDRTATYGAAEELSRGFAQVGVNDNGSESDGGIQMFDNDDEGDLEVVPGIPEEGQEPCDEVDPREAGKLAILDEQKCLGSMSTARKLRTTS